MDPFNVRLTRLYIDSHTAEGAAARDQGRHRFQLRGRPYYRRFRTPRARSGGFDSQNLHAGDVVDPPSSGMELTDSSGEYRPLRDGRRGLFGIFNGRVSKLVRTVH